MRLPPQVYRGGSLRADTAFPTARFRVDWAIYLFTWRGRTWKDRFLFAGWLGAFLFAGLYIMEWIARP